MTDLQVALLVTLLRVGDTGRWPDGRAMSRQERAWLAEFTVRAFPVLRPGLRRD